ncbi:MAG: glycosyltransferase [Candidatus Komeilibacteria bacterium]|nr:glycosyltransferase [Candidatus Komeilibacteria bacterium]
MKICFLNSFFSPDNRGGAEMIVNSLAVFLTRQGHDVVVICTALDGHHVSETVTAEGAEIIVHRLASHNIAPYGQIGSVAPILKPLWHIRDMFNGTQAREVTALVSALAPDLIWTHNLKGLSYTVLRHLKATKIPIYSHIHDIQFAVPSGLLNLEKVDSFNLVHFVYRQIIKTVLPQTGVQWIFPSRWLLAFYQTYGLFKHDVQVSPNPLPTINLAPSLKVANRRVNVYYAGQLEEHKGLSDLLTVASENWFEQKADLFIAGEGSRRALVTKLANRCGHISYLGLLPLARLVNELRNNADLVIVPSRCLENQPTIISLALALKIPVLASASGGIPEMIGETNGLLFKPGSVDDLRRQLQITLSMDLTAYKKNIVCPNPTSDEYLAKLFKTLP